MVGCELKLMKPKELYFLEVSYFDPSSSTIEHGTHGSGEKSFGEAHYYASQLWNRAEDYGRNDARRIVKESNGSIETVITIKKPFTFIKKYIHDEEK